MLAQCACFESGEAGAFAEDGEDRHDALAKHLAGDDSLLALLDEDDAEAVRWAAEYVRLKAPILDHELRIEQRVTLVTDDFNEVSGTPDVVCGPELFDFKWRERDYAAQMACYALARMQEGGRDYIRVHLLFGAFRRVQVLEFDLSSARRLVQSIYARATDPKQQPKACDYCGWCAKRLSCPALVGVAKEVATGYGDGKISVANWHPSEMREAEQIALGLTIWRKILKPWGESMEFHAREAAIKGGLSLPGFELKERKGKRVCTDVAKAFELSQLPAGLFLQACALRFASSKKYADQKGVEDIFAAHNGMKKAPAKRALAEKLSEVIKTNPPTLALVDAGDKDEGEE